MLTTTEIRARREIVDPTPPYPPSWLDRVTAWVRQLPGPAGVYFLLLLALQLAYVHVVLWANGKLAVGAIDLERSFMVFLAPYFLWVRFYLDRVAGAALRTFRPALTVGDAEFSQLRYRLTTLPAREARIVTVGSALVYLWSLVRLSPEIPEQYAASREAGLLVMGPLAFIAAVTVAVSTYHAIHQLRMVAHIHRLAAQVQLFRLRPLYAFSGLTARTGMSFLLVVSFLVAILPNVMERPLARILFVPVVPIGVASFVLPLLGMRRRIAAERQRLLAEANRRLEALLVRLHQRVDDEVVSDADKVNAQLASLVAERVLLEKMSTWPWNAETVTGFVTALILPVILWLVQRMLERKVF